MHALVLLCINQCTKIKVPSFTSYRDMIGAKFKKTRHVTLITPISVEKILLLLQSQRFLFGEPSLSKKIG